MTAGRPREFDYDEVLEKAMRVFWQKGFEGTSIPDLTRAMGINRPSIYAAFGNKEALFRKALGRYSEAQLRAMRKALSEPDIRAAVRGFFDMMIETYTCPESPKGCFAVQGALVGSDNAAAVCEETLARRADVVKVLEERFARAAAEAEIPPGTDTKALARFYAALLHGLSVQSASGATCDDLRQIVQMAVKALPA